MNGTVKWFNSRKGYGFITPEDGENDLFVHYSAINVEDENDYRSLNEGDEVTFEVEEGQKGPQAVSVIVTKRAPRQERRRDYQVGGNYRSYSWKRY